MQLQFSTWPEVEAYLEQSQGIIVPIGSSEQHGPMGLIGTDALCPEVIAQRAAEEASIMVGPTLSVGMSQHHLGFAGSITLRPTTLIAVIKDYVNSLALNGFRRFYFLNGHGGNVATIGAAFSEIYSERSLQGHALPSVECCLMNWYQFEGVSKLSAEYYGNREGSHATPSEIAVTQYAFPESIKSVELAPAPAETRRFTDAKRYRELYPDGRMRSDSFLARPEHGKEFIDLCVKQLKRDYVQFIQG